MGAREVFRNPELHVATLQELATVHVAELNDGTVAWIESTQAQFVLEKSAGLVDNGTTIIQPLVGSPRAGASGAAWVMLNVGGIITPFRFIPVLAASTTSVAFVDLLTVPGGVTVMEPGIVELDFDASIEVLVGSALLDFKGANFRFLWDGVPPPGDPEAFFEIDPSVATTAFNTFSMGVRFRAFPLVTVGTYPVSVQWMSVNSGAPFDTLLAFDQCGHLTIEGKR